jgi:hypothetical protein
LYFFFLSCNQFFFSPVLLVLYVWPFYWKIILLFNHAKMWWAHKNYRFSKYDFNLKGWVWKKIGWKLFMYICSHWCLVDVPCSFVSYLKYCVMFKSYWSEKPLLSVNFETTTKNNKQKYEKRLLIGFTVKVISSKIWILYKFVRKIYDL